MDAVDVEGDTSILKTHYTEVKPAFRVAFTIGALTISRSPQGKLVRVSLDSFTEITAIEVRVDRHLVTEVIELKCIFMWDYCQFVLYHASLGRFYQSFDLILLTDVLSYYYQRGSFLR
jgi:hypothetical protein